MNYIHTYIHMYKLHISFLNLHIMFNLQTTISLLNIVLKHLFQIQQSYRAPWNNWGWRLTSAVGMHVSYNTPFCYFKIIDSKKVNVDIFSINYDLKTTLKYWSEFYIFWMFARFVHSILGGVLMQWCCGFHFKLYIVITCREEVEFSKCVCVVCVLMCKLVHVYVGIHVLFMGARGQSLVL